jgi:uncharacterized damage-inducible protein DinB
VKPLFEMMAAYNAWATGGVSAAAAQLTEAEYRADRGAFFGSLHGTLNHILVGDQVWMRRFTGSGPAPTQLNAILHDDLAVLRVAREAEDARIVRYVASLTAADLAGNIRYRTISSPTDIEQPLAAALPHFFNHQTHHRGQAHCLLTQLNGAAPSLDLILFQRESGVGLVSGQGGTFDRPQQRPDTARSA